MRSSSDLWIFLLEATSCPLSRCADVRLPVLTAREWGSVPAGTFEFCTCHARIQYSYRSLSCNPHRFTLCTRCNQIRLMHVSFSSPLNLLAGLPPQELTPRRSKYLVVHACCGSLCVGVVFGVRWHPNIWLCIRAFVACAGCGVWCAIAP